MTNSSEMQTNHVTPTASRRYRRLPACSLCEPWNFFSDSPKLASSHQSHHGGSYSPPSPSPKKERGRGRGCQLLVFSPNFSRTAAPRKPPSSAGTSEKHHHHALSTVTLWAILLTFFLTSQAMALEPNTPIVYGLPAGALPKAKAKITSGDPSLKPAYHKLIQDADKALKVKPLSVMDKPKAGASGDKHDYYSTAPYFWPDRNKPDGLPYIRRDGFKNPDSHNESSDSPRIVKMATTVHTLALAYYFTGKEDYAKHAAKLLRVWFLDPSTKMNPNFNQAQAVPGLYTGRGTGMVESRNLTSVMDAVGLLQGSSHWSKADQGAMVSWMKDFLDWAQTSKIGKAEKVAKNNHGSFYDMQTTHMALFTGQKELAKTIVESAKTNRIALQFKPDGSQPLELAREDSFGYSKFNLQALFDLAGLGEYVGVDLWHYPTPDAPSLKRGLDFLLPYAEDSAKEWPYEHEKKASHGLQPLLRQAWLIYRDERYLKAVHQAPGAERERDALFYPLQ